MTALAPVTPDPLGPDRQALGALFGVASQSTGSILLDASLGALAGYAVAPAGGKQRWRYVAIGAVATGLAGVLGLAGTLAYGYVQRRR